jgi:hypothetical protein
VLTRNQERAVVVDRRFCGLPELAHGGYVGGLMAAALGGAGVAVRLRKPVPTASPLRLDLVDDDRVELRDGETPLAEGTRAEVVLEVPEPVSLAQAQAASRHYPGHAAHLFPGCYGCGPGRHPGDGLRIFPGAVPGRRLVAAPWLPGPELGDAAGHVPTELVWAAFDCPQLWAIIAHAPADAGEKLVTGELAAKLARPVVAKAPHVVIAWPLGRDDRRLRAGAALIGPDGEVCAIGLQTAVIAKWGVPLGLARWRSPAS